MRSLAKLTVPLGVLLFVAGSVRAQNLTSSRFTDPATLVQNKAVQKHLDLSEATIQKAFNIPILIRQEVEPHIVKLNEIEDKAERERQKQVWKRKTMQKGIDELAKILDQHQLKRLKEIALQMSDYQAFSTKEIKQTLAITVDQEKQLKDIIAAGNEEMKNAIDAANVNKGDMDTMWRVSRPARKQAMAKAMEVLTPDQRKKWNGMVGEEFDFSLDRPGKGLLPFTGGPVPATDAEKNNPKWLAARIDDWMPQGKDKSFDQIGWVPELCKAMELAKEKNRAVFIFVLDGDVGSGRC